MSYSKNTFSWHYILFPASFALKSGLNKRVVHTQKLQFLTSHSLWNITTTQTLTVKVKESESRSLDISVIYMSHIQENFVAVLTSFYFSVTFDTTDHFFLESSLLTFMMPCFPSFSSASLSISQCFIPCFSLLVQHLNSEFLNNVPSFTTWFIWCDYSGSYSTHKP